MESGLILSLAVGVVNRLPPALRGKSMNKEKLIAEIMKEYPEITKEEAEEMAEMELRDKENRRYEQGEKPRKKADKVRKVDNEKKEILSAIKVLIEGMQLNRGQCEDTTLKAETELSFTLYGNSYTLKLIKHRPTK